MRNEVRDARIKAGLTQVALAQLSGVPRKQVLALESGKNVTLKTFEKIVTKIPGLQRIHIGEVEIAMSDDGEQNRLDLMEISQGIRRVLDRLGGPILPEGARYDGGPLISPERVQQLEGLITAILRGDPPTADPEPTQLRRPGRPLGSRNDPLK